MLCRAHGWKYKLKQGVDDSKTRWHKSSVQSSMIGMLENGFVSRDAEIWNNLYVSMVRPYLEYAVSVWSPHSSKDIDALKKVKERVLMIPHELR